MSRMMLSYIQRTHCPFTWSIFVLTHSTCQGYYLRALQELKIPTPLVEASIYSQTYINDNDNCRSKSKWYKYASFLVYGTQPQNEWTIWRTLRKVCFEWYLSKPLWSVWKPVLLSVLINQLITWKHVWPKQKAVFSIEMCSW